MYDWVKAAGQYGSGFGKGLGGFVTDTAEGIKDLAVGGYQLATDASAREAAWETTKTLANTAKQGIDYALDNPTGAVNAVRDTVASAYGDFQAERALAAAEGRLAEFDGQLAGRILPELIPVGKLAKLGKLGKLAKLDKAADLASDAKKLEEAGLLADKAEDAKQALSAVDKAADLSKRAPTPAMRCPLAEAPKKSPTPQSTSKPAANQAGKPAQPKAKTATGGEPVSMATGEELLELADFAWDGPVPLDWTRFYRTGQSGVDLQLGHGWLTPLDEWLEVSATGVAYHDREGRTIELPLPDMGCYSLNRPEQLRLHREQGHYRLTGEDEPQPHLRHRPGPLPPVALAKRHRPGHRTGLRRDRPGPRLGVQLGQGAAHPARRRADCRHRPGHFGRARLRICRRALRPLPLRRGGRLDRHPRPLGPRRALRLPEPRHHPPHPGLRVQLPFRMGPFRPGRPLHPQWGDGGVYATRFAWTDAGISRAIDSRGGVSEYMHDKNALLLWETTPEGRTTRYAYTAQNQLHSVTDPAGHATRYAYDDEGRATAVTDPLGHAYRLAYSDAGKPVTLTDPLGQVWHRNYDGQGRVTQTQDPQGGITRISYNALGLPAQITNALGQPRTLLWDESARLVGETGADGIRRRFHYDAEDRLVAAVTQDQRTTRYQYDPAGRVIAVQAPDGGVVRLEYNAQGLVTQHTAADGNTTQYRYADGLSQITERTDPAGHTLRYRYDSERNLVALVNAKGEEYRLGYDKDENLVEETGFDGRVQRYHYGADGQLDAYAQSSGDGWQLTRFGRDPLGRLAAQDPARRQRQRVRLRPAGPLAHRPQRLQHPNVPVQCIRPSHRGTPKRRSGQARVRRARQPHRHANPGRAPGRLPARRARPGTRRPARRAGAHPAPVRRTRAGVRPPAGRDGQPV